jgi:glycosyltransferase involved in cell wall biosynthesis
MTPEQAAQDRNGWPEWSERSARFKTHVLPRLDFLARLALAGRFDEVGRRLLGLKSSGPVGGTGDRPYARERRTGRIPPQPWRIAAFIHETALSGAPTSLLELATALQRRGDAHVQILAPGEGPIATASRAAGLEVAIHGIELRDLLSRRQWNAAVAHLAGVIQRFAPHLVHANSVMTAPALAAARLAGVPMLLNVREGAPDEHLFRFLPHDIAVEAFATLRAADEAVFVSRASHEGWARYFPADACHVITNSLRGDDAAPGARAETRTRLRIPDDTLVILCVGSYCERKGQADLVAAIGRLPDRALPRVHVVMMGEAEPFYLADLRRRVHRLDAARRSAISLLSAQAQPASFYAAADVFVCCSRSEGFPRVTLEAMRAGLPVIATPIAGIVEQFLSDEALFYPPGDTAALTDRIMRLLDDRGLRSDLARRASAASARHADFAGMVDRYVMAYRHSFAQASQPGCGAASVAPQRPPSP